MIVNPNIWGAFKDAASNDVWPNLVGSGAPINGTTGAGLAGPASLYFDYTNGVKYFNEGTKASPIWTALSGVYWARMLYDFAVDGGAIGVITPIQTMIVPNKAIVLGGFIDTVTPVTSGGAATISLGTSAGSGAASLKAAVILGTEFGAGIHALVPVFTAATMFKMTADGTLNMTVASFALTAGKFGVQLAYMLGD